MTIRATLLSLEDLPIAVPISGLTNVSLSKQDLVYTIDMENEFTTVFVDTRLSKTKHPRNFSKISVNHTRPNVTVSYFFQS